MSDLVSIHVLRDMLARQVQQSSQYQWATKHKLSPQYLSDVLRGRREVGPALAAALGYEKVIMYKKKAPLR